MELFDVPEDWGGWEIVESIGGARLLGKVVTAIVENGDHVRPDDETIPAVILVLNPSFELVAGRSIQGFMVPKQNALSGEMQVGLATQTFCDATIYSFMNRFSTPCTMVRWATRRSVRHLHPLDQKALREALVTLRRSLKETERKIDTRNTD